MIALVLLFILLFLVLLLSMPVIVTAKGRFSPVGGAVRGQIVLLGAIPVPVKAKVRLFSDPYLTVQIFGKTLPMLSSKPRPLPDPKSYRVERVDLGLTLGIEDEPARTVQALGLLEVLCSMLLPRVASRGNVRVTPSFTHGVLRISAEAIVLVFPLFLLFSPKKRIEKVHPANDTQRLSSKERYSHVPC